MCYKQLLFHTLFIFHLEFGDVVHGLDW